jgi:hypothetical protein
MHRIEGFRQATAPNCSEQGRQQLQMKPKGAKKKIRVFSDLKQSLSEALAYEQGKKTALRVTKV